MTWYYIYRDADGSLVSETSVAPDMPELAARGLAVKQRAERQEPGTVWDPIALDFVPAAKPAEIQRGTFLLRFTTEEQVALDIAAGVRGSYASLLEKWVAYANGAVIDTQNPQLRGLVQALEMTGVIGEGRALEILDG